MNEDFLKAVVTGDLETVENLLPATDVHERNEHGGTYLMYAVYKNNVTVVRALIEAGADINAMDKHGHSVLYCAALQNALETVYLLHTYGVKIDMFDPIFRPTLKFLLEKEWIDMADLLVEMAKKELPGKS